jgi:mono/diheme cytochrome c family protein
MKPLQPILTALLLILALQHAAAAPPQAAVNERHKPLLNTYCVKCHGAETQEGKFRVDELPFVITDIETAERWQKVLNALNAGEMPPSDEKQPDRAVKTDFLEDLSNAMVAARKSLGDQNGVITMRRLNRREYKNTLRELLGVEVSVSELPSDAGNGGFDTVGTNLFMSANQFEQYQALGREALDEMFDRQAAANVEKKLRYEVEDSTPKIRKLVAAETEARERALRWIKAVEEAAARPENAVIVAEIRKTAKDDSTFRRSWAKIKGAPSPELFGFVTNETPADKANRAANNIYMNPYKEHYLAQPALDRGGYLTIRGEADLNSWITLNVPFDFPVGDYVVRARLGITPQATPERQFLEFGINPRHGQVESTHHITASMDAPQIVEMPLTMTRRHGVRENRTVFIREKGTADDIYQQRARFNAGLKKNGIGPELALWVDWIEIERKPNANQPPPPGLAALGIPLDDKSKAPTGDELRAALKRFAIEAFRGNTPSDAYLQRLAALYDNRRQAGDKHSVALKETLSVVLASPMFLYLAEPSADEKRRPLTSLELASRLSYFLWGAPPDATLRDLAARDALQQPAVLAAQTTRLLDDPRSEGFVDAFVYQWLGLDRLDFFQVNRDLHPRMDNSTKLEARREVYATFRHVLQNNASLRDLLKTDYAVLNAVLANYCGIPGVSGDEFRPVQLPPDSPRGGLLGMAAIHIMGGNGEITSPVDRGAWVLRKLLNDPPPPAPANIPAITRLAGQALTTRERLLAHQQDAQCASCHRRIDPIGFGLENFDAVGQWRTEDSYQVRDENGKPVPNAKKTWTIDPAAAFYKGPAFKDYFELRGHIAGRSDDFAHGFTLALLEYALGRPVGFRDEPLITDILQETSKKDFALREFILALVRSQEFHTK